MSDKSRVLDDADELKRLYIKKGMSKADIAEIAGCSSRTVGRRFDEYGIEAREAIPPHNPLRDEPELLRELYIEKDMTASEMADRFRCSASSVARWLAYNNISRRDKAEAIKHWTRRQPVPFMTRKDGYECWVDNSNGTHDHVWAHRLLAVFKYGFDAIKEKHIHHKNDVPWDNRAENITLMDPGEHTKHHHEALSKVEKVRAVELYRNGESSLVEVGEVLGVSAQPVRNALKEAEQRHDHALLDVVIEDVTVGEGPPPIPGDTDDPRVAEHD